MSQKVILHMTDTTIRVPKARLILAGWGLPILLAGMITQWFDLPNPNYALLLWAGVSLLGVAAQVVGLVRGLGPNLGLWLLLIFIGWAFTLYVVTLDNGTHIALYGDVPGVWLALLGVGYLATAFQVDKRFLAVAALHFGGAIALEAVARGSISVDFLADNGPLLFGLIGGLSPLVAALPIWTAARRHADIPLSRVA